MVRMGWLGPSSPANSSRTQTPAALTDPAKGLCCQFSVASFQFRVKGLFRVLHGATVAVGHRRCHGFAGHGLDEGFADVVAGAFEGVGVG